MTLNVVTLTDIGRLGPESMRIISEYTENVLNWLFRTVLSIFLQNCTNNYMILNFF